MAEAIICDVCGKVYTKTSCERTDGGYWFGAHIEPLKGRSEEFDLCKDCTDELLNWLGSRRAAFEEKNND